ncbi:MAG: hypothetical protein EOP07_22855 [Proteobacteria bacterium]|nr:MAG: hypothetical protein EOP07_22855 [Pseudomonadota bacterium]
MAFSELEKILKETAIKYKVFMTLATNSLKIGFYKDDPKKADSYLWIDPAWRITKNNVNVLNSFNYPYHENYEDEDREKEKQDFLKWANSADDLQKNLKLTDLQISSKGDLSIQFQEHYDLDVFVNDVVEYGWYFRDIVEDLIYEVSIGKIAERKSETEEA